MDQWKRREKDRRETAIAVAWGMWKQKRKDEAALYKAIKIMENYANDAAWIEDLIAAFERRRLPPAA